MAKIAVLFLLLFMREDTECVNQCISKYPPYFRGYYMKVVDCPGATLRNSTLADASVVCCVFDTATVPPIPQNVNVSMDVYLRMAGDTIRTRALYPFYMQALSTAGISWKWEIAAFTAQILYQTSGMKFSEKLENADDERKYISRGFLPLIGQHMYQLVSSSVEKNIISWPEIVAFPSTGFQVAAWLWRNGYSSHDNSNLPTGDLGRFCDGTEYSFVQLSYNIQGSTSGIEKLFQYWRHTVQVLGLPCPYKGKGPVCQSGKRKGRCKLLTSCKGEYTSEGCLGPAPISCCLDCQNPIDLAFVLDSSASVTKSNFKIGLQFIARVCEFFDIGYPHGTRIALIRFSSLPTIIFRFNTFINKQDVLEAIRSTPYEAGRTQTNLALLKAHSHIFGNPAHGVRPKVLGVPRVLVLLTDGRSTSGMDAIVNASSLLRQDGVTVFAIGIGNNINKQELNVIASDPDADHVASSKSFAEIGKMVEKMRESSCYEPALLEEEKELTLSVQENSVKYFKYDLQDANEMKTLFFEATSGKGEVIVSMKDKNPRNYYLDIGFCSVNHLLMYELEQLERSDFCNVTVHGGCTKPRFVSNEEFMDEGIIVYVRKCSSRWLYVSIEGKNKTNMFNLTLFKDFIGTTKVEVKNTTDSPENKTATFPIPKSVYVGVAVATIGTITTVAAAVTLSCAREFEMKRSDKIKKKKKEKPKAATTNNNAEVNKGFEDNENERLEKFEKRSSLTPLVHKYKHLSNGGPSTNIAERETQFLEKEAICSIYVAEMEKTNSKNNARISSCSNEDQKRKRSHETVTSTGNTSTNKRPTPRPQLSLVSSMIHDLQREETFIKETVPSVRLGPAGGDSPLEKSARMEKQVTRANVSISVDNPNRKADIQNYDAQMMKRNCEMSFTNLGGKTERDRSKRMNHTADNCYNKNKGFSEHQNKGTLDTNDTNLKRSSKYSQLNQSKSHENTTCCFDWIPSLSPDEVKRAARPGSDPQEIDLEKNKVEAEPDDQREEETFFQIVKAKLTWRNVLAALFPCFTYYILGKGNKKSPEVKEMEEDEKTQCEIRDHRFERDMQMSQAFCVLLSQIVFLVGADARDNKAACAVAAITMNYLSLVTVCWLIVQALYLFSFTKWRDNESKQRMKINMYYAMAWGLPLFTVAILASKHDSYSKHPHCWISFSDTLSWSVATPMITLGLVQFILIILLVKALVMYRKSASADENEDRKNVIKSGLKTVVCITITVIVTWLLGSLSLNVDRDVYHMFFTIFNALQGFAFFLFYVVLNPQFRQFILVVWTWKESMVTPFDEHEAIQIEEDKDENKKKEKRSNKLPNDRQKKKEDIRTMEDQSNAGTVVNVAGAKVAATSIVNDKKGVKENVSLNKIRDKKGTGKSSLIFQDTTTKKEEQSTAKSMNVVEAKVVSASMVRKKKEAEEDVTLVKFSDKKETRNTSLEKRPDGNEPVKKLPPINRQRKVSASSEVEATKPKMAVQGSSSIKHKDATPKRGAKEFLSSPKDVRRNSPTPSGGQQTRTSPRLNMRATYFELKDDVPVAAVSSPTTIRPRSVPLKLDPITSQPSPRAKQTFKSVIKNHKPVGKRNTSSKARKT